MEQQQAQVLVRREVLSAILGPTRRRARLDDRAQRPQLGRQPSAQPTLQPNGGRGGWYASSWSHRDLGGCCCLAPSSSPEQPRWLHLLSPPPPPPHPCAPSSHHIQDGIG